MYTVQSAIITKLVKCHSLADVEMMFNRIDFIGALYCGGFDYYKFVVFCQYNNSPYDVIMTGEIDTVGGTAALFTTFDQFKEHQDQWHVR